MNAIENGHVTNEILIVAGNLLEEIGKCLSFKIDAAFGPNFTIY